MTYEELLNAVEAAGVELAEAEANMSGSGQISNRLNAAEDEMDRLNALLEQAEIDADQEVLTKNVSHRHRGRAHGPTDWVDYVGADSVLDLWVRPGNDVSFSVTERVEIHGGNQVRVNTIYFDLTAKNVKVLRDQLNAIDLDIVNP